MKSTLEMFDNTMLCTRHDPCLSGKCFVKSFSALHLVSTWGPAGPVYYGTAELENWDNWGNTATKIEGIFKHYVFVCAYKLPWNQICCTLKA